jgi:protein gp37
MARRLHAMGQANYVNGFIPTAHEHVLERPLSWSKPQVIFINSMSDLFHRDVEDDFIHKVFQVMNQAHWHEFQILTKRADRLARLSSSLPWAPNIWMGVSVEQRDFLGRIDLLRETGAAIKFLSLEPLLGPLVDMNLQSIDWVIVGGESGPGARPMEKGWVEDIQNQCENAGVPFFFKQWGGKNKKKAGRTLNGKVYDRVPFSDAR